MKEKTQTNLLILSGFIAMTGAIAQIFDIKIAPYIFSTGAAGLIVLSFLAMQGAKNSDSRIQRLYRSGFFSSLLLALAAYLMFTASGLWVLAVLIYALSALYMTFRL